MVRHEITVRDLVDLVRQGCIDECGMVSVHLDTGGRYVYDLWCDVEEMPSIIWREWMITNSGSYVDYRRDGTRFGEHVDYVRQNNCYGVPQVKVEMTVDQKDCWWVNDEGYPVHSDALPRICSSYYMDTALIPKR